MTMQSPEMLLTELNKALRRLRAACKDLDDEDIDQKLLDVMRRLLLAEVLGNTWIIAMGGSQGAGKTTLMSSLYDLNGMDAANWLQSNEGRGEKMPVLILEQTGVTEPQGYVRRLVFDETTKRFELAEDEVDIEKFQRAICDPEAGDLLPVLRVPCRYFKRENQAWLLLPGYEKQDRANRSWQDLMRQAMIAAGGCVVVTDETRLANQQQLEIVRDMLENELKNCRPYIVISKTEAHRHDTKRQAELRASAQATFRVDADQAHKHIILTGTDDLQYREEWMPMLRDAIYDLNFTGPSDRHLQMTHLSELVGKDLTRVLNAIRSKSRLYFNSDKVGGADGEEVLADVLEKFDEAVETLRAKHHKAVEKAALDARGEAYGAMQSRLQREHEGFRNWISNAFDTTSESQGKMQELVQTCWRQAIPTLLSRYTSASAELTREALGPLREEQAPDGPIARLTQEQSQARMQLGYQRASGQAVQFEKLTPEAIQDIRILLGNSSKQEEQAHQDASKQLGGSVKLIPAMSLEYSRLIYAMPKVLGLKNDLTPIEEPSDSNIVTDGVNSVKSGVELGKTAIRSLAAVMAVDVISDGDSDILGALFGQASTDAGETTSSLPVPMPMTLHPAAVAATAVVAAAYVTVSAVTRMRTFERKTSEQAYAMLHSVHDSYVAHLRDQFNDTMAVVRTHIQEKMRARYRMDEMLMHKDRLASAIADVTSLNSDLQHELNASASGLQFLAAGGTAHNG
ncbi:hypothetical protein [Achromobacter sp. JUb104]|uniref:hypothetical protein n=1 Tax=Achromobacter sp. JUb104 TaxID=2940590 RepID=UPI002169FAC3|nr:hypothetical protein [Achromobacter sp. JUb104]MCS3507471.1 signal recognition particle receptor subunit beta [Achromobacter sp. JUb104]